jgi:Ni/Co efflux regulator RcnB
MAERRDFEDHLMKKKMIAALSAITAMTSVLSAVPVQAQNHDRDRDRRGSDQREWNRGRDNRDDRDRRWDNRSNRGDNRGNRSRSQRNRWRSYGGDYGYNGYQGRWRTGQRYPNYRNNRYVISDYRQYDLPPPRNGYRYYRDDSGDVIMAAVATGVIGLILGNALGGGF